jgi:hypothetical protein
MIRKGPCTSHSRNMKDEDVFRSMGVGQIRRLIMPNLEISNYPGCGFCVARNTAVVSLILQPPCRLRAGEAISITSPRSTLRRVSPFRHFQRRLDDLPENPKKPENFVEYLCVLSETRPRGDVPC